MFVINQNECTWCAGCAAVCPAAAIVIYDRAGRITDSCLDCGVCAAFCPISAVGPAERTAEGADS